MLLALVVATLAEDPVVYFKETFADGECACWLRAVVCVSCFVFFPTSVVCVSSFILYPPNSCFLSMPPSSPLFLISLPLSPSSPLLLVSYPSTCLLFTLTLLMLDSLLQLYIVILAHWVGEDYLVVVTTSFCSLMTDVCIKLLHIR